MSREIRELDAETRDRIAAGEVIERPASAVKELLENALDADASRVDVTVEDGGIEGITVADDGVGMDRAAVERAIEEHTTSKIRDIEDLESGVGTLGFRGEALHAIAAVSRTTITTRPRDAAEPTGNEAEEDSEDGTELVVEGGEVTAIRPAGRPPGTTVEVGDLFYNVPARRKYLKQPSTEFAHVNTVVARYALANPDVAVSLTHGDREVFATTGRGEMQETVLSVYGREVARSMIEVEATDTGSNGLPDGPLDGISGLVSHPETNRAGREYLATYVNGRSIRSATVREAIVAAYGTQLAPDRYPFAVLFLDVDPTTVDVNVHPRKREIRFADEEGVRTQVEAAVEDALLDAGLIRSSAPRGRSAPEQTTVVPTDAEEGSVGDDGEDPVTRDDDGRTGRTAGSEERSLAAASESDDGDAAQPAWSTDDDDGNTETDPTVATDARTGTGTETTDSSATVSSHDRQRRFASGEEQARLGGEEPETTYERLPSMRILGQFLETYVVAETEDGLLLVDQHAADERINYERLRERFAAEPTTQSLAAPVTVELTAREAAVFDDRAEGLADLGFHAERVDDRTVEVSAVPGLLADAAGPDLVRDLLAAYVEGADAADATVQSAADHLLGDLACYPSVTANTSLAEGSIRELLSALDACENPYACPHGRPVIVSITAEELEDRFERDYPGHQGRRE